MKDYPQSVKEGIYVWRKVPKSAFNLFLTIIIINGLVVSCQTYFVVYATSILKMSLTQWAIVVAFRYLTIAIPAIIAGFSMDVLGRKRFLILGYLLYVPGMLLFINANFDTLLLAFFFFGLGNLLQLNSYMVLMGDLIPRNLRGTATGCLQFFMFIAQGYFSSFNRLPLCLRVASTTLFAAGGISYSTFYLCILASLRAQYQGSLKKCYLF